MRNLTLILFMLMPALLRAELSPEVYKNLKRDAPEMLVVSVVEARSQRTSGFFLSGTGEWRESVTLRVERVERSRSGMVAGKELRTEYTRAVHRAGWVGPVPLPKLAKGGRYRAWLELGADGAWKPAARGHSFEPVGE